MRVAPLDAMRAGIVAIAGAVGLAALAASFTLRAAPGGAPAPAARPEQPGAQASAQRLRADVQALTQRFFPRDHAHPDNLDRAAAWLRAGFEQARAAAVSEQPFEAGGRRYRNVVAAFGPEGGERVVVGAHYDAAGEHPGADDNASGVAGLLELARLLGAGPALARRVELVAYSLEEPPWFGTDRMGSAVHADGLRGQGAQLVAMLSLEMIGYFTDAPGSQRYPAAELAAVYPSRGNFIGVVGRVEDRALVSRVERAMRAASPLPVQSLAAPASLPGIGLSDHASYWRAGFVAAMVTDTAFHRNPNYHGAADTADTLDYARMAQVVQGVHAAVLALARP